MELIDKITKKMATAYNETWDKLMQQCFPNGDIDYKRIAVIHNPHYQEMKLDGLTIGTLYWKMRDNTISCVFNPVRDGKLTVEFPIL